MYRPNFCAECGKKIVRLRWYIWTSRSFCLGCAPRFRNSHIYRPVSLAVALFLIGLFAGRSGRRAAPPLIIERSANSPLLATSTSNNQSVPGSSLKAVVEEDVYICGARTKKGTPCSRRVHGPVRCWQHKGMPAMIPLEKLKVKT